MSLAILGFQPRQALHPVLSWIDQTDGHVYRMPLGKQKRLVVACGAKSVRSSVGFAVMYPSPRAIGRLHLTSIPSQEGFTVLAFASKQAGPWAFSGSKSRTINPVALATNRASGWRVSVRFGLATLEPAHTHEYPSGLHFQSPSKSFQYLFKGTRSDRNRELLGFVSANEAVILDDSRVIQLNLETRKVILLAKAHDAVLWQSVGKADKVPVPTAKAYLRRQMGPLPAGSYEWKMRDPTNFRPKLAYLKRSI